MSFRWLSRKTLQTPYFTLCTNEKDFRKVIKHLKVKDHIEFLNSTAGACTHTLYKKGKVTCVVTADMKDMNKQDQVWSIGMLVHEAVHVWQKLRDDIGEKYPSSEFEAYSIQYISQELMQEYRRQRNEYQRRIARTKKAT